jgi:hypothetical protein
MARRPDCPNIVSCEMCDLLKLAGTLAIWKTNYCTSDFERCERYKLSSIGRPVPRALLPNGVLLRHLAKDKSDKT